MKFALKYSEHENADYSAACKVKMEEIAVAEMLNSFALSGDTDRPLAHEAVELHEEKIVSPSNTDTGFMASVLNGFHLGRHMTFKVLSNNSSILSLKRIEPYDYRGIFNESFNDPDNLVLLVAPPSDCVTEVKRRSGVIEFSMSIGSQIKSAWCRRGDIVNYYCPDAVFLK